jgi:predicted enzyme related to lactoylglutathione lyase
MAIQARYVHTNLIARDWQRLSRFYQDVFGCQPVPPERHFAGPDLERGTGVHGSELHGAHLRFPGFEGEVPTLEIFSYSLLLGRSTLHAVNEPGFGHIAFAVADVPKARETVLAAGGATVGEVVTLLLETGAQVTWCYVRDPEGNIIELQSVAPAVTG